MKKIILASQSPRRKALLKQIGLDFEVIVSSFEEKIDKNLKPGELAEKFSLEKAKDVAKRQKNAIIIAADTFVVLGNEILGKPKTKELAKKMLEKLSGKAHLVITGFTIIDTKSGKTVTKSVESKLFMKKLTKEEIDTYVNTGEPLDKAGAYAVQEKGGLFIKKIEGDFFNVVGLPIFAVTWELKKFGINILQG